MRKDRVAEWLLESVTTPERAASTVGDLRESAASRGEVWFWSSVLRTAGSLLGRAVAAAPHALLGLGFRWMLVGIALELACGCSIGLTFAALLKLGLGRFVNPAAPLLYFALASPCQYQLGRWIARRAPGRELPACLALLLMQLIVDQSIALATGSAAITLAEPFLYLWPFVGALQVRRKGLAHA